MKQSVIFIALAILLANGCKHEDAVVVPPENQPPEILALTSNLEAIIVNDQSTENDTALVTCEAVDPENGPLSFLFKGTYTMNDNSVFSATVQLSKFDSRDNVATVRQWTCCDKQVVVTCSVFDSEGKGVGKSIKIPIRGAQKVARILSVTAEPDTVGVGEYATITCNAKDTNGDSLSYSWESTGYGTPGEGPEIVQTGMPNVIRWRADHLLTYAIRCSVTENRLTLGGGYYPFVADRKSVFVTVTDN